MVRRRLLLVLDDEKAACDQLMTHLARFRDWCDVEVFHEWLEAQPVVLERAPDLLLLDPRLPDCDGLDLIRMFVIEHPEAAVVILLPHGLENLGQEALESGAVGILTKPYQASQVDEIVSRSLGIRYGLGGNVDGISLSDLVQLIHAKKWDRTVLVHSGDGKVGRIHFLKGEVLHVEADEAKGIEAFNEILQWPQGRFEIRTGCYTATRSVRIPTMQLLLDGLRQHDESGKMQEAEESLLGSDEQIGAMFDSILVGAEGEEAIENLAQDVADESGEEEPQPAKGPASAPGGASGGPAGAGGTGTLPISAIGEALMRILAELRARWGIADWCAIVDERGFVLAGDLASPVADRFWSLLFGATAAFFDDSAAQHGRGLFRQAVLSGSRGALVVLTIPRTSCFLVATIKPEARLGLALTGLEASLDRLSHALQEFLS